MPSGEDALTLGLPAPTNNKTTATCHSGEENPENVAQCSDILQEHLVTGQGEIASD